MSTAMQTDTYPTRSLSSSLISLPYSELRPDQLEKINFLKEAVSNLDDDRFGQKIDIYADLKVFGTEIENKPTRCVTSSYIASESDLDDLKNETRAALFDICQEHPAGLIADIYNHFNFRSHIHLNGRGRSQATKHNFLMQITPRLISIQNLEIQEYLLRKDPPSPQTAHSRRMITGDWKICEPVILIHEDDDFHHNRLSALINFFRHNIQLGEEIKWTP